MRLDAVLRAHGFMKVERPPKLWEADTEDVRFLPLLGEMIAAPLSRGAELHDLTLSVSNVIVPPADEESVDTLGPEPGEYVAVTVKGRADVGPDSSWSPARQTASGLLRKLAHRLL